MASANLAVSQTLSSRKLFDGKATIPPPKYTPGLYLHKTRPISFTLVVDDFGVKYVDKENTLHLEKTLQDLSLPNEIRLGR